MRILIVVIGIGLSLNLSGCLKNSRGIKRPSFRTRPTHNAAVTGSQALTAAWANDGLDKVTRDEVRATESPASVLNRVWDGNSIRLFGARNEVVAFNVILEAARDTASDITVEFNQLSGPGGVIRSRSATADRPDAVFDWTERDIELFLVGYLPIRGLSKTAYNQYDERHTPRRFQRPWSKDGEASGRWEDRPDHDKEYPDIAIPLEVTPSFTIYPHQNQSIWTDIYIPKSAQPGLYEGSFNVYEAGHLSYQLPVQLTVRDITLPDTPTAQTMVYLGYADIGERYVGKRYPQTGTPEEDLLRRIRDRHFQMAHRHRLSLIDSNEGAAPTHDQPANQWLPRLDGALFTAKHGYRGPGEGVGNGVFAIGAYGSWEWKAEDRRAMWTRTDGWADWFASNSPTTDYFLYLADESADYAQQQTWASWIHSNPGPGRAVRSMATVSLLDAISRIPDLDIPTSAYEVAPTSDWNAAQEQVIASEGKSFYMYNGHRPGSGSFVIEDDGVALRELAWGQYKMQIPRWFYWESTYYNNYQGKMGQTDVFQNAQTFGGKPTFDRVLGMTGWNYGNGDGVLFYPGTDTLYPDHSLGLPGPIASLRLKYWRRGIQDVDYLSLAAAKDPARVNQIISHLIPQVLWEVGVTDPKDPSWVKCDIHWPTNPDTWEEARAKLADLIENRD